MDSFSTSRIIGLIMLKYLNLEKRQADPYGIVQPGWIVVKGAHTSSGKIF